MTEQGGDSSHGMFSMPWVRNVVALKKPTAQTLGRGYLPRFLG